MWRGMARLLCEWTSHRGAKNEYTHRQSLSCTSGCYDWAHLDTSPRRGIWEYSFDSSDKRRVMRRKINLSRNCGPFLHEYPLGDGQKGRRIIILEYNRIGYDDVALRYCILPELLPMLAINITWLWIIPSIMDNILINIHHYYSILC